MTIALVAHAQTAGGANGGTSPPVNTGGASPPVNALFVCVSSYNNTATISDSFGNAWGSPVASSTVSTGVGDKLYYCASPIVGAGHTISTAGSGIYAIAEFLAFSGVGALDVTAAANDGGAGASTLTVPATGTLMPTHANSLIIAGLASEVATTATINEGFSITDQADIVGGSYYSGAAAYLIQTAIAGVNPQWGGTATGSAATLAVFSPAVTTVHGALAETQADQAAALGGSVVNPGTLAETQADQTSVIAGSVANPGAVAQTQTSQTSAITGSVADPGAISATQTDQTATLAGSVANPGALAATQTDQTSIIPGSISDRGTLAQTQPDQTSVITGTAGVAAIHGALGQTQADESPTLAGSVADRGALAQAGSDQTATLTGTTTARVFTASPSALRTITLPASSRTVTAISASRTVTLPSSSRTAKIAN